MCYKFFLLSFGCGSASQQATHFYGQWLVRFAVEGSGRDNESQHLPVSPKHLQTPLISTPILTCP